MRRILKQVTGLLTRHYQAGWYVISVVLPTLIRTGKRPVIFNKYSGIGDIICTIPAVLELKKRHPHSICIYNCHPDYTCLPKLGGVTDVVTSLKDIGPVGYWYRFLLGGFYNMASDDDNQRVSHSELYVKGFGSNHGVSVSGEHPPLTIGQEALSKVMSILESKGIDPNGLIVLHPGPTWPVKEWPVECWTSLVRELRQRGFTSIIRLGVAKHLALGSVAVADIPGAVSLVDQLSLEESLALISLGRLFIGVDSGLLHGAVSIQTPAVGLWGATSSQFLFSDHEARSFLTSCVECQGCHHRIPRLHWMVGCPNDIACMKAIQVEDILRACLARLG